MKNQIFNEIVYSMMKNFNATKLFSVCSKDKEGKNYLDINMSRNKKKFYIGMKVLTGDLCLGMSLDVPCPRSDG
jgi:hypothetical protein